MFCLLKLDDILNSLYITQENISNQSYIHLFFSFLLIYKTRPTDFDLQLGCCISDAFSIFYGMNQNEKTEKYHTIITVQNQFYFYFWCFNATFNNISAISCVQFQWWRKPEYLERTTDHGQTTGKLYHLRLQVECTLFVIYKARRKPTPYW